MIRNAVEHVLGRFASRGIALLANIVVARHYSPAEFGVLSYGLFTTTYFQMLSDGGIGIYGIKATAETPREGLSDRVRELLGARLRVGFVAALVSVLAVLLLIHDRQFRAMSVLCILALVPLTAAADYVLIGRGCERELSIARTVNAVVYLLAVVLCIVAGAHIYWIAGAVLLGNLAGIATQYWAIVRRLQLRIWQLLRGERRPFGIRRYVNSFFTIFVAFGYPVLHSVDVYVIGRLFGSAAVGEYSAAYRVVFIFAEVYTVVGMTLLSHLSARRAGGAGGGALNPRLVLAMALAGFAVSAGLSGGAGLVLHLFYGAKYDGAVGLMRWFAFAGGLYLLIVILSNYAVSAARYRLVFGGYVVALATNVVLSVWVLRSSVLQILIATLVSEVILVGYLAVGLRRARLARPERGMVLEAVAP